MKKVLKEAISSFRVNNKLKNIHNKIQNKNHKVQIIKTFPLIKKSYLKNK